MEWYVEYEVINNRLGTLGDLASFLGLMGVNILMINGIAAGRRGLLLDCKDKSLVEFMKDAFTKLRSVKILAFREPTFIDRISLKHGKVICQEAGSPATYSFVREDLGMLVDFLGELFLHENPIIGLRGMPRVGKTEATIAASVYANKKWVIISSTLMRQSMRKVLSAEELAGDCVYLIDGIVSCVRGSLPHKELVEEILQQPVPKVIEHPDIYLRENDLHVDFFDYIIELRRDKDEVIDYNLVSQSFSSFDIS